MKASKNKVLKYLDVMVEHMVNHRSSKIEELVSRIVTEYSQLKSDTYMVTKSAVKLIEKINVDKIGLEIYNQIPDGIYAICMMIEDNSMILIEKKDMLMTTVILTIKQSDKGMGFNYTSIRADLDLGSLRVAENDMDPSLTYENEKFVRGHLKQIVAYIFLSDIEIKMVPIQAKYGTAANKDRLKNDSHTLLKLVTEKWNTVTISVGEFGVSGHFAWRATGVGRLERRLVYIDSYLKGGYTRRRRQEQ